MRFRSPNLVRSIAVLVLSIVGLSAPLSPASAQDKPTVLMIARMDMAPVAGEAGVKVGIDREAKVMISKLNAFGYAVDVASDDGKDIQAGGSSLKVDKKLADVNSSRYVGVIIPCMTAGWAPPEAVRIVSEMQSRNLPVAAQNGGVFVLDAAGTLEGRSYAVGRDIQKYVKHGALKGEGVVRDGDIVTSGVCPFAAQSFGLKDGTDELVATFVAMLKE